MKQTASRVHWRWTDKDFGFRFCTGVGRTKAEYYQASEPGAFYTVPAKLRKLSKDCIEELAMAQPPTSPRIVPMPWKDYDREWDWIANADGILLNFAGCLDREEIHRREDEGVARAMELVATFLHRVEPVALTSAIIRQIHTELMGAIYPFAGAWRTVSLHKGDGPTKWPLPPSGIAPLMDVLDRDVLSRSPFVSDDDSKVFAYVSEVVGELLAIHPFREGNGRMAFVLANLLLMQNDLLPLHVYDRRDEAPYYSACEEVRVHKNYGPLAGLVAEWEQAAQSDGSPPMTGRRVNVKAILADADLRRKLMVSTIQATQAREAIDTSPEQADRAYYVVSEGDKASCFALREFKRARNDADGREVAFVQALRGTGATVRVDVPRRDFRVIDGAPLSFDKVQILGPVFTEHPMLEAQAQIHQGVITRDDSRFLRSHWETTPRQTARPWKLLHKGGEFCRFYYDTDLVIDWSPGAQDAMHRLRDTELYFREGLTWPLRTQRGLNVRKMESGCVFSHKGGGILLADRESLFFVLGLLNSSFVEYAGRCLASFGSWEVRVMRAIPVPQRKGASAKEIERAAMCIHSAKAHWDAGNETSTRFDLPWLLKKEFVGEATTLTERLAWVSTSEAKAESRLGGSYQNLNRAVYDLYQIPDATRDAIEANLGERPPEILWPQMEGKTTEQKRMEHVWRLLSFAVKRVIEADDDGIVPFTQATGETRLVDRVRKEISALFPGREESQLEVEIVNELKRGVKGYRKCASLDDWLANAFFEYHASLYKSRPIFWHIASSQGTAPFAFAALVHYHRFDKNRMARLRSTYLRDAMDTFRREAALAGKEGRADERVEWQAKLEEAQDLDRRLQWVQEGYHEGAEGGDKDHRILTPWKAPQDRPKGWDPDIDDGVKVNIEPLQKAGVLRIPKVV